MQQMPSIIHNGNYGCVGLCEVLEFRSSSTFLVKLKLVLLSPNSLWALSWVLPRSSERESIFVALVVGGSKGSRV